MKSKMKSLGTAACPPYHLAFVVGGTSAELTSRPSSSPARATSTTCPPAAARGATPSGTWSSRPRCCRPLARLGLGAQFGGKWFCLDTRVIRLPRHGASCPIGLGVSCSADRNIKAKITRDGIFLEQLETDPARYLPPLAGGARRGAVDLNRPMERSAPP
jgi:fumarate hydratase, class I